MALNQKRRAVWGAAKDDASLPAARSDGPAPTASERRGRKGKSSAGETILVVDDDVTVRELVAEVLRYAGFRVIEATDGADAQRIIGCTSDIRLLLTDLSMPVMSGFELVRWMRTAHPGMPILIMTGSLQELNQFVHWSDPIPLLLKPFAPRQLVAAIRAVRGRPGAARRRSTANAIVAGDRLLLREEELGPSCDPD